jgi:hypothetical protein
MKKNASPSSASSSSLFNNQIVDMPPEDPAERLQVALEYRHYLIQFMKAVVYGQRKEYWRSPEGSYPLSVMLINVITMTDLLKMDEYCSLFFFINIGSTDIIEALICNQRLAISQRWVVHLSWGYSVYQFYLIDKCVETINNTDDEETIVANFVSNIEELITRDLINLKDPQMTPFQCIFETMLNRLIRFDNIKYYIRIIQAFMDCQTQPEFKEFGKIIYLLSDTVYKKKQISFDIKNLVRIYIDTNMVQERCFLECNDSVHEMDKYLKKIKGMDETMISKIHDIISADTPLDKDGFIINKLEKEKKRKKGRMTIMENNNSNSSSSDSSSDGDETDETYENKSAEEESNSSSNSSNSSNDSDDDNEKLIDILKRKRNKKK